MLFRERTMIRKILYSSLCNTKQSKKHLRSEFNFIRAKNSRERGNYVKVLFLFLVLKSHLTLNNFLSLLSIFPVFPLLNSTLKHFSTPQFPKFFIQFPSILFFSCFSSLQIKVQASPSSTISSFSENLSELSPTSEAVASPSTSTSSHADLGDVLTGKGLSSQVIRSIFCLESKLVDVTY